MKIRINGIKKIRPKYRLETNGRASLHSLSKINEIGPKHPHNKPVPITWVAVNSSTR